MCARARLHRVCVSLVKDLQGGFALGSGERRVVAPLYSLLVGIVCLSVQRHTA